MTYRESGCNGNVPHQNNMLLTDLDTVRMTVAATNNSRTRWFPHTVALISCAPVAVLAKATELYG